jgi:hypothetical protein
MQALHELQDLALYCNRLTISESMSTLSKVTHLPGFVHQELHTCSGMPHSLTATMLCFWEVFAGNLNNQHWSLPSFAPALIPASSPPALLTQLQELSLESPDAQLVIAPHASLPPNLTRLFAVDCFLTDVPGQQLVARNDPSFLASCVFS